jgi:hypothetical protein
MFKVGGWFENGTMLPEQEYYSLDDALYKAYDYLQPDRFTFKVEKVVVSIGNITLFTFLGIY